MLYGTLSKVFLPDPADDVISPLPFRYFANEPFADLHRVEGLRGVFIATLINGSVSEDNMRSVITFDKGGTWELLQPPAADSLGGTVDCQVPPPTRTPSMIQGPTCRPSL